MEQPTSARQAANAGQMASGAGPIGKNHATMVAGLIAGFAFLLFGFFIFIPAGGMGPLFMIGMFFLLIAGTIAFHAYQSSKGKQLQLKIDRPAYSPGEEITGSIILFLDKGKQARSLKVRFYGMQRSGKHRYQVCRTETILSGARVYQRGESLGFSLVVPSDAMKYSQDATRYLIKAAGYENANATDWYVEAQLDIPNEIDIIKREPVGLLAPGGAQAAPAAQQQA
ncbi:MAG: hypothetical protein WC861_05635 [Candidatus Micrarchaeia archaeon]|jgi:hypothetical protein